MAANSPESLGLNPLSEQELMFQRVVSGLHPRSDTSEKEPADSFWVRATLAIGDFYDPEIRRKIRELDLNVFKEHSARSSHMPAVELQTAMVRLFNSSLRQHELFAMIPRIARVQYGDEFGEEIKALYEQFLEQQKQERSRRLGRPPKSE